MEYTTFELILLLTELLTIFKSMLINRTPSELNRFIRQYKYVQELSNIKEDDLVEYNYIVCNNFMAYCNEHIIQYDIHEKLYKEKHNKHYIKDDYDLFRLESIYIDIKDHIREYKKIIENLKLNLANSANKWNLENTAGFAMYEMIDKKDQNLRIDFTFENIKL